MTDLDDFFAKKDRKKSKSKKFATSEEVAKKLDDTSTRKQVIKKERTQEVDDGTVPENEQDEWKEFEEEKKDYSGLKIGNLTINSAEGTAGNTENLSEQSEGDTGGSETEKRSGPWRKLGADSQEVEEKISEPTPVVSVAPTPSFTGGAYIPPSLRNQQHQPIQPSRLKSRAAPDINNEAFFPSLSTTKSEQRKTRNEGSFEVVTHNKSSSLRQAEQSKFSTTQGPKLNLGNRYNTLSNDS